ncbi:phosphopantetheine-binding protein [Boseaceae bacterium BT-24-1]|nr:phosphopantetheine-binding protein [Boseaceae bacterium BT-24-1]
MVTISSHETGLQVGWPEFADPTLVPRILDIIAIESMIDRAAIRPDATLETLGVDSIEVVMIVNGLEDAFNATIPSELRLGDADNLAQLVGILGAAIAQGHDELKA